MCECYQIGGPFIAEDPDCPVHGVGGYAERLEATEARIAELEATLARILALTPVAANARTAQDLHLTVKAIADSAIHNHQRTDVDDELVEIARLICHAPWACKNVCDGCKVRAQTIITIRGGRM